MKAFRVRGLRRRYKFILVLLVIGLVLLIFNSWANNSVNGTVSSTSRISQPKVQSQTFHRVTTPYYSTLLPDNWRVEESAPTNTGRYSLVTFNSGYSEAQIAITTAPLPSGGLTAVSDYNLRKLETSQYYVLSSSGLPAGSVTFKSSDEVNQTLFMTNSSRYVSISVSGSSNDQAFSLLAKVSASFKWK